MGFRVLRTSSSIPKHLALNSEMATSFIEPLLPSSSLGSCYSGWLMKSPALSYVQDHFCAYSDLQNDSAWAKLRGTPGFGELVSEAKKWRDDFLAQKGGAL
jgi:hypothetical protein